MARLRTKEATKVTVVGIFINVFLTVLKFSAGILGRSGALMADAVHSLSDFLTDIVAIISIQVSSRRKDEKFHYGYGKFETLAGLCISVVLLIVGGNIFYSSVLKIVKIYHGQHLDQPGVIAVVAALVAFFSKEWLYRYTIKAGNKLKSQAVIANAWEHRSDAFSSLAAFFGIGAASVLGQRWVFLDPLTAVVVSIFIIKMSIKLTYDNVIELSESAIDQEKMTQITQLAFQVPGVYNPHSIRTRKIGHYCAIDMHIEVDPSLKVVKAHNIGSRVKKQLRKSFGRNTFVSIHIDPHFKSRETVNV